MEDPKRLFIHAGAHRTGTSSFQMCLHQNRSALENAGFDLAFPGRDGVDSGTLGLRLPAPRHGAMATARFAPSTSMEIERHSPVQHRALILSEENILGRMIHFMSGQFYPAAEARFGAMRVGMRDAQVERLVLVVRNYADLFVSGFRKRAEDNFSDPFVSSAENMANIDRGWPEIVASLRDIFQPSELIVIPYGFRGSSVSLLHNLVPQTRPLDLTEPEKAVNVSATDAALLALQRRYGAGEKLSRDEWQQVIADYTDDKTPHGFAEFTPNQRAKLDAKYALDLERLMSMRGVQVQN